MGLSRNTVRVLIALMAIAIGGILYLQYRLLRNNVELKEESFGHSVMAALNDAAYRMEEVDLRDRFFSSPADSGEPLVLRFKRHGVPERVPSDSTVFISVLTSKEGALSAKITGDKLSYEVASPETITIRMFDELGRLDTTILKGRVETGTHELSLPKSTATADVRFIQIRGERATSTIRWETGKGYRYRVETDEESHAARIMGRVAETVIAGRPPRLADRIRRGLLDTAISVGLTGQGISLPYEFGLQDFDADTILYRPVMDKEHAPEPTYASPVFPGGFAGSPGQILLWFPGYRSYLFQSILPELVLNLLFVLMIGACFHYALRTLRRQREFAGRLTDFINNMTHEFKTPLSTIALSTEALARPDVAADRSKVEMYGGIIADEHRRMRSQVDRILELAALEEGEFEFRKERLDLHEVIGKASANSGLRVGERGGTVTTDLRAADHDVRGDAMHIENVVNNVLDNAEKYSPDAPSIRVATYNADGCIVVSVSDRGIGIAPEHLPNIFEKYFRVPTHNLHDVKGFGIGLSYVRLVVERHGGSVRAQSSQRSESSPGRGTTIELKFPVDDGR